MTEGSTGENGLCLDSTDPVNAPQDSLRYRFAQDIVKFLSDNPSKKLLDYPGLNQQKFEASAQIKSFLAASQPGTKKIDKPIMIIQGTADMSVPYPVTLALYNAMKAQGTNVQLLTVPGATHTQAIVDKNADAVNFIQTYMPARP